MVTLFGVTIATTAAEIAALVAKEQVPVCSVNDSIGVVTPPPAPSSNAVDRPPERLPGFFIGRAFTDFVFVWAPGINWLRIHDGQILKAKGSKSLEITADAEIERTWEILWLVHGRRNDQWPSAVDYCRASQKIDPPIKMKPRAVGALQSKMVGLVLSTVVRGFDPKIPH